MYEILGEAAIHVGGPDEAARAFSSLVEVAPARPELLQRAGLLLLRLAGRPGSEKFVALAEAPLRRAVELRPDRVNGYRHLALFLSQTGRYEEAARVLEDAGGRQFPQWYGDSQRVVREELGYVYRAWMAADPRSRADVTERASRYGIDLDRRDALRITLAWETDANDVDLHVVDPEGRECFYGQRTAGDLELYQDITRGFGPEVIRTAHPQHGTYHVGVNYFSAGPMGVSRGVVVIHRGSDVEIIPFRLMEGGRDIRKIAEVKM